MDELLDELLLDGLDELLLLDELLEGLWPRMSCFWTNSWSWT